jgi:hypothetical protein
MTPIIGTYSITGSFKFAHEVLDLQKGRQVGLRVFKQVDFRQTVLVPIPLPQALAEQLMPQKDNGECYLLGLVCKSNERARGGTLTV